MKNENKSGKSLPEGLIILIIVGVIAGCVFLLVKLIPKKERNFNYIVDIEEQKAANTNFFGIAPDVNFSIINSDTYLNYKRSLTVLLSKKISEDALRNLALKLKSQDPRNYERTFISYILPGMKENAGAWATTHFDPELEVKILGLTIEQEAFLRRPIEQTSREIIGSWLNDEPFLGSRITIFHEDGKLFLETLYSDGSMGKREIVEKQSTQGQAFERKEGSSVGEYYFIDSEGNLQLWDEEGFVFRAKKIN